MTAVTGVALDPGDALVAVVERRCNALQAEQKGFFEYALSLLPKIAEISEHQTIEYSNKHSNLQAAFTSRDWVSTDVLTKFWAGLRLVHLKSNGKPILVQLSSLAPDYARNRESHIRCVKALELLEEAELVTVYRRNDYTSDPLLLVVGVNLTEQGKAYVASLKTPPVRN